MEILQYIPLHMTKKVLGKNPSEDPLPHPRTLNLTLTSYGGAFFRGVSITQIAYCNTFHFLRWAQFRYAKCIEFIGLRVQNYMKTSMERFSNIIYIGSVGDFVFHLYLLYTIFLYHFELLLIQYLKRKGKDPAWSPATLLIQKLWHRCFCDFCKTFKNTYFVEHLRTTASEKQINCRFNIKSGFTFNYLPEKW